MKKIVIAGGTGFIGSYITKRFKSAGFDVTIISRSSDNGWSPVELSSAIEGSYVLINLAGKNINCRHDTKNKREILFSRVDSTTTLATVLKKCKKPPTLWINASAVALYPPSIHKPNNEYQTTFAETFLSDVVQSWENALFASMLPYTRKIALRTSVVLSNHGGAFVKLCKLTKWGLGGLQGDGLQVFSWIHIEDYFRILLFLINNPKVEGVVNATSPNPISNNRLMFTLRQALRVSFGLPAPEFLVRIGAWFSGTEASLILDSINVIPRKLSDYKFQFKYPTIDLAMLDLLNQE